MTNESVCAVCGVSASLKCGGCKNVVYCGKEHQKIHWKKGHKAACKCYEITKNDTLGRHMIATRDIKAGEIIVRESPLIYGPKIAITPTCLGCHRVLPPPKRNYYKCTKCGWPLCDAVCEQSAQHAPECQLMTSRKFSAKIDYNPASEGNPKRESAYCVILPLRCMLLKSSNPADFQRLMALEDHLKERIGTPLYKVLTSNLVTFVQQVLGLSSWTETEILQIAAILDTNTFDVHQPWLGRTVRAIYSTAAMISHDCIPNARHTFDEQMQILFLAKKPISKGEIITTTYTQLLKSTLMRRQHLMQSKCFECTCERCKDPEECDTFMGSILCSKCKIGKIISTNPLDNAAPWQCQLCKREMAAKQMNLGNDAIQKEIASLDKSSPRQLEEFIYRYRDTLHEKNTHVLQTKYALTQLYGNAPGYLLHEISDYDLQRKVELCYELLEIADKFDGGWSLFRGNLLLDLQDAIAVQAKRQFENGLESRQATQEKLAEAMDLLKEAIEILQLEPDMKDTLRQRTEQLAAQMSED